MLGDQQTSCQTWLRALVASAPLVVQAATQPPACCRCNSDCTQSETRMPRDNEVAFVKMDDPLAAEKPSALTAARVQLRGVRLRLRHERLGGRLSRQGLQQLREPHRAGRLGVLDLGHHLHLPLRVPGLPGQVRRVPSSARRRFPRGALDICFDSRCWTPRSADVINRIGWLWVDRGGDLLGADPRTAVLQPPHLLEDWRVAAGRRAQPHLVRHLPRRCPVLPSTPAGSPWRRS